MNKLFDMDVGLTDEKCKGLFFRGSTSEYINSKRDYVTVDKLRFLKRMSCKGCEHCEGLLEYYQGYWFEDYLDVEDKIIHGELYVLEWYFNGGYNEDGTQESAMRMRLIKGDK